MENTIEQEPKPEVKENGTKTIAGAIIVAGILIAGAILLRGNTDSSATPSVPLADITLSPVSTNDKTLGDSGAKVTMIAYEDFQCPFCGRFVQDAEQTVRDNYVNTGKVRLVYRDFAFLGPESTQSAEAARCAADQGKFWEYHDYLFSHQNGENQGSFADVHLKAFAKTLGLDTASFNTCLGTGKYTQAIADAKKEASTAGVQGTPKIFLVTDKDISSKTRDAILKIAYIPNQEPAVSFYNTKNILSLNGALPGTMVTAILDELLK